MDAHCEQLARLSDTVAEISSGLVATRRSMMVFRARMQAVETVVADLGDDLGGLDARFLEIREQALQAAAKSRDTVDLCEHWLERETAEVD